MRVLLVHNRYQQRGGEDVVVETESEMLRAGGHLVHVELVSNESINGFARKVNATVRASYDPARRAWIRELLERWRPDVVHIHNFFPLLTPAVHKAASEGGVAVVQTLHNYRLLCANAKFLRDGAICEKCLAKGRVWGVVHRCYRGSTLGSLAVALMQWRTEHERTWHRHVDRFIALTEFARDKFIAGGLPSERIVVKPNSVSDPGGHPPSGPRHGALFVGRLSPEKGVANLVTAWRHLPEIPLTIVGDGPERGRLEPQAPANVWFAGQLPPAQVRELMRSTQALILPSICYEGFPLSVVEAYAAGLPVIASRLGSLSEVVIAGETGQFFEPFSPLSLAESVKNAFGQDGLLESLGLGARRAYEQRYSALENLRQIETIYAEAIAQARSRLPQ